MSGLGELGGLYGFDNGGQQVSQRDIDQYDLVTVNNPSVDGSFIGTYSGTGPVGGGAVVIKNVFLDWPRNVKYATNGIAAGTYGGTFTANYLDQFGAAVTEKVVVGTAVQGGTVMGTAIVYQFISGTFQPVGSAGTFIGTASIGVGTGAGTGGNWFGLFTKLAGTQDLINVRWVNNGTYTAIGGGSLIGTLANAANHSFQGTSGVAITDSYIAIIKPTFDNQGKGTMSNL